MADTTLTRLARARGRALRRSVGQQLLDLREARGLSIREVARAASLDPRWLSRAEAGDGNLTMDAVAALATVLGADPSLRLYQATGPRLRDHVQVRLIDTLVAALGPRWQPRLEVPVYRPSRGVIDLVLAAPARRQLAAGEAHSEIRRAEQQLRWAAEKTDSLPSASGWPWMDGTPTTARLLVLRSSREVRAVVASAPALFRAAYPGRTADAIDALTGDSRDLPESTVIWVDVRGRASRLLEGPPRAIDVGR